MTTFPQLSEAFRISRLQHPRRKVRIVLDTDTYNEIDDQFALTYALLSPEEMSLEAIYAAPFHNARSDSAGDGMEKSYDEILRLLAFLNRGADGFAFRGSTAFLGADRQPQDNAAVRDMIEKALASADDDPLYVVAIGAITNVASALLLAPEIVRKIVVVWLGGHNLNWSARAGIQPEAGCTSSAGGARQRRTLRHRTVSRRDLTPADHPGGATNFHRRNLSSRRLPLPDIQGLSTRFIWLLQRDLGHFNHRLADQSGLGT